MKRERKALRQNRRHSLQSCHSIRLPAGRRRKLHIEQLESRRVLTLPVTQTFAEGDMITYNGPPVDVVNDTLSFDAFIDFAGDVDSYFFAPQFSGTYTIDVGDFGNTVDPEVAIYIASTGARVAYNDDLSSVNDDARLIVNLVADVRYIVAVADQPGTTAGNVSIIVTAPFRTGSFLLSPDVFGDATASVLLDVPTDIDYYSITAPANATGILTVTTSASTFNHRLALFDSTGRLTQGPLVSLAISNANPNQEYRIAVFPNGYATSGTLQLNINFANAGALVTNTADSGPGSLRQAILDANVHPNDSGAVDKIIFNIPGAGPHNIVLASALPFITDAVDINGGTQPGTGATPTVAIDGTALTGAIDGLRIEAAGTAIHKLNVRKFPSDGIEIHASGVLLEGNTIGTDWGGLVAFGNGAHGIHIQGGSNRIEANVVSGNGLSGIAIVGDTADDNQLTNNTVGARFGGGSALGNFANGIIITDGDSNTLNGNLISGNTQSGVVLTGTAVTNSLIGNKIGTTVTGNVAMPNQGDGVFIQSPRNKIGGNLPSLRNVISGNAKSGITLSGIGASNNVVEGNYIGTNASGTGAVPNATDGIRVINAARNRIGSTSDAAAGNVISGNVGSGVAFSAAGSTGGLLLGNLIGTAADGLSALGNSGSGVLIFSSATNIQIGGTNATSRNVIAANGASGITISSSATNNRVSRNRIGVNTAGAALGNTNAGISIQGPGNTIGGINATFTNIIAGNPQGIVLSGASASSNTISFNTIGTDTVSNAGRGIQISGGASTNTLGPKNTIRRNETGIRVDTGSIENRITQNSIAENINLGIDLFPAVGVTANDGGDADTGGNRLQNFPQISGNPLLVGSDLEISFSVNSSPVHAAYPLTIEFFVSDGGNEGATFLGSTLYTEANFAAGVKTVNFAGAGTGLTVGATKIVGTATDLRGNTSEFSSQRTLAAGLGLLSTQPQGASSPGSLNSGKVIQPRNVLDVNGDGHLTSSDAVMLIGYFNSTANPAIHTASVHSLPYADVDADGRISPQDVLLVVRGIQLAATNRLAVAASNQLVGKEIWDASLVELMTSNLPVVQNALSASAWVPYF